MLREFSPGDKRLVAYVVPQSGSPDSADVAEIRNYLKGKLPDYMVPSAFEVLDQLPLTPNGKVDRKALPEPKSARAAQQADFAPASTEVEKHIATVWRKLLQVEQIGLHDNFFDLGGHSLLVTRVHAELCEAFGAELPIIKLFQYPTISALTAFVSERGQPMLDKVRDRGRRKQAAFAVRTKPERGVMA